jgi:hypothetical protein
MLVVISAPRILAEDIKTNAWGRINNHVQMLITLKNGENEIKTNQPIILLVRIRTDSTNEIFSSQLDALVNTDQLLGLLCIVISPSGKDISPQKKSNSAGSGRLVIVRKDQIAHFEFNLGSLCKFEEIGTYKIVAKKELNRNSDNKTFTAESNPLYVSVMPNN